MLKIRMRRDANGNAGAARRLMQMKVSITELGDEDLLDLADIFRERSDTPIAQCASAEMAKRRISL